jgi:hypothetical protein
VNDGPALEETLAGILDEYPQLATAACVPLGLSRFSNEAAMRPHTTAEAAAVVDLVEEWQEIFLTTLGRRLVFAADEYYLLADRPFPPAAAYEGFPQHENGIGMARAFEAAFGGDEEAARGVHSGFFSWVDGAPAEGYRAPRQADPRPEVGPGPGADARRPVAIITGEYGVPVLGPILAGHEAAGGPVRLLPVHNHFFGGNIAVTGLLTGADVAEALRGEPAGDRYLLPDVCLSQGRFLDGLGLDDLPHPVEVVPCDGLSLRRALESDPMSLFGAGPESVRVPIVLQGAR